MSKAGPVRCAIYTRKSNEKGLEQQFNSLDAQREACEAYVKSQAHEGWTAAAVIAMVTVVSRVVRWTGPRYGTMLADIAAGRIDTVVVYKIDRLTRSLADFARMVDLFDRQKLPLSRLHRRLILPARWGG